MGPAGDCPCIRQSRGQKVPITETFISPDLFALLPEEDQRTINDLKHKALALYIVAKNTP
jgi:hypothetical protein